MNKFYKYCTNTDLHATVILPGGCNAKCSFCYDISENIAIENYSDKLNDVIETIPIEVRKFAITGMETSLSPYFKDVLKLAAKYKNENRFDFIFLNTNGSNLIKYVNEINASLDAINISRHSPDDTENFKIFNTQSVPTKEQLKEIISQLDLESGVNVNMVVTDDLSDHKVEKNTMEMIKFCKYIGATSLTLRFEATDRLRTHALKNFLHKFDTVKENANPGCHFWLKKINGFDVVLKYVTKEPTSYSNWNYGFIIQRDFRVTRDWQGLKPHNFSTNKIIT